MSKTISHDILVAALAGFRLEQQQLEQKIANVEALLKGQRAETAGPATASGGRRKKRSAAARRRMAEAQKARWARVKGESQPVSEPAPSKAKRKLSAAGRQAIVAALKRRWAAKKAGTANASAKKATSKRAAKKRAATPAQKAGSKNAAPRVQSAGTAAQ